MSEPAEVYDGVELGRRIVVCFSIGELRQLADSLGVGGSIAWERGIHEASRDLVRQCERYAGLPALVAKLHEIRPLVEWPAPAGQLAAPPVLAAPPPQEPPGSLPAVPSFGPPAGPASAPPLADPFAPAMMPVAPPPRAPDVREVPAALPPAPRPAPRAAPAAWPGVAAEPAASRGVDPRILVAVAGLMVLAAVIAYLAGRASTGGGSAIAAAPADSAGAEAGRHGDGPATLASDTISRSLANLARVCELPAGAGGNLLVFRRVFDRCGPLPPQPRPAPTPVATQPDPNAEPPPDAPTRTRRQGRGADPAAPDPGTPSRSCTSACDATHRACKTGCGPEPTESGGYDGYQRCLGRCLSDASRCRLSCR